MDDTSRDSRAVRQEEGNQGGTKKSEEQDWVDDRRNYEIEWGSSDKTAKTEDSDPEESFRDEGTSYYKASSISILNEADKEFILPLIPLGTQAKFYSPEETTTKLAWWGSALCGCVLFSAASTWIAALSLSLPLILPWSLAGLRNFELQSNGRTAFMGIWHCQVLASEVIEAAVRSKDGLFGNSEGPSTETMVRLMIGDPWSSGARTEMVVPLSKRDELPGIGELCDLLVLSKNSDFRDFKAVREAFFPRTRVWLAEYPFINRDNFYRLVVAIQKKQNEVIMDRDHW